jgi:hypothetical protein
MDLSFLNNSILSDQILFQENTKKLFKIKKGLPTAHSAIISETGYDISKNLKDLDSAAQGFYLC